MPRRSSINNKAELVVQHFRLGCSCLSNGCCCHLSLTGFVWLHRRNKQKRGNTRATHRAPNIRCLLSPWSSLFGMYVSERVLHSSPCKIQMAANLVCLHCCSDELFSKQANAERAMGVPYCSAILCDWMTPCSELHLASSYWNVSMIGSNFSTLQTLVQLTFRGRENNDTIGWVIKTSAS